MAIKVNPGEFRTPIEIQRNAQDVTAAGSRPEPIWETVATGRAKVEPVRGVKAIINGAVQSTTTHFVQLRYFPGLTTNHRIVIKQGQDRALYIDQVTNLEERNHIHECLCTEGKEAASE